MNAERQSDRLDRTKQLDLGDRGSVPAQLERLDRDRVERPVKLERPVR
jgi:hypothetical protein